MFFPGKSNLQGDSLNWFYPQLSLTSDTVYLLTEPQKMNFEALSSYELYRNLIFYMLLKLQSLVIQESLVESLLLKKDAFMSFSNLNFKLR